MTNLALNRVLLANAAFSSLCAIDMLLFPQVIANFMGGFPAQYLQALAGGLILFACFVIWVAYKEDNIKLAKEIVWMDRSWVVGSIGLIIFANQLFSQGGLLLIAVIAVIVAGFSEIQAKHIKQMIQSA